MTLERQLTNGKVRDLLAATKNQKPKKIKKYKTQKKQKTKNKKQKTKIHYKTVLVNVYVRKANGL